jgi:acetyltransferase-like isoleucine patch superfamily enzyme
VIDSAEPTGLSWWRMRMRVSRRVRTLRARALGLRPGITTGSGTQIGARCRILVEPGAQLVLGSRVEIDDGTTLAVYRGGRLELGAGGFVGHHSTLAARESVFIGANTFLAELVSVRDHDHDPAAPPSTGSSRRAAVRIGHDVWIASKVTVTRGVEIGDRSVIGANAVVTNHLPSDVIAGGIPARVLRDKSAPPQQQ